MSTGRTCGSALHNIVVSVDKHVGRGKLLDTFQYYNQHNLKSLKERVELLYIILWIVLTSTWVESNTLIHRSTVQPGARQYNTDLMIQPSEGSLLLGR
ncbi:hypothetical protein J6590_068154 [Homalodisca vitripennis]|nr:hypothetical protein J6590_068154 [Homalodisca vitripennis]